MPESRIFETLKIENEVGHELEIEMLGADAQLALCCGDGVYVFTIEEKYIDRVISYIGRGVYGTREGF